MNTPHPVHAALPAAEPASLGLNADRCRHVVQRLQQDCEGGRLPGAVVLLARHGRCAVFDAVGWRDPATRDPMTRDALFRIYSMTKPITSVAALMLLEQGALLMDEPLARILPEFATPQVVDPQAASGLRPASRPIQMLDVLRHTCGFSYEFMSAGVVQRAYAQARVGARDRDNAAFATTLATLPLMADPGTMWEYSRATDVLGRVIEVVGGLPLGQFLQRNILDPLGMQDTGFAVPAADHPRLAEAFARDPDGGLQMRLYDARHDPAFESGGGGLVSTAADYARFAQTLLNRGQLGGARLLAPPTVAWMTSDQLGGLTPTPGMSQTLLPTGHGFGLGVAVRTHAAPCYEPGSVGNYFWGGMGGTTFFVDPALDLVAVLMLQAPNQREHYRSLFRNLVYACVVA